MPRDLVIIDRHRGQLGNRLMFFASAYAYARHEGRRLKFPTFQRYAEFFPAMAASPWCDPDAGTHGGEPAPANMDRWVARRRLLARLGVLPGVVRKPRGLRAAAIAPSAAFPGPRASRAPRLYFTGWRFFNPAGLHERRAAIGAALKFRDDLTRDADDFTARLDPARLWLAAHVRGGDYAHFLGGKHLHTPETIARHLRAAAAALAPRPVGFVVFSNEPREAREFAGVDVVVSGGSPMQDFARLARLPGVVGPMSTFTAFAMYLRGGVAWHIGPSCDEDGLGWVYAGYPVVRSADAFAAAVREADARGQFRPAIDFAAVDPRPRKR